MALDSIFLHAVKTEIEKELISSKIDKVYQPEKDEIVLSFRSIGKGYRLLLSANANHPRVHFTEAKLENPQNPPMFCMLLRKHLLGGKLTEIYQQPFERVLRFTFDCFNELGDEVKKYLYIEIMGRYSNIIFTDGDNRIIDAVKHVDLTMSSQRQIMPGLNYFMPPSQDKLILSKDNIDVITDRLKQIDERLDKALLNTVSGLSPLVCRELSYLTSKQTDIRTSVLNEDAFDRLKFNLKTLCDMYSTGSYSPVILRKPEDKKPFEFCFMNITQYGRLALCESGFTPSEVLESFYFEKAKKESIKQRASDIFRVITNAVERISKKINLQESELKTCADKNKLVLYGDLITANLYRLKTGDRFASVENYYEESCPVIDIPLDLSLSPSANAQRYYKEYRKAKNAEGFLKEQLEKGRAELSYLETVFDGLSKAENERELAEIRNELEAAGYLKKQGKKQKGKQQISLPMEFITSDGFTVYAGKNNLQNDLLTLKTARKQDIWFHTKNIPGSHTILVTDGKNPTHEAMTEAAVIAATYSRGRDSKNVPVDYTEVRNVKKPAGAKPGFVIYETYKTAYVTPDAELSEKLRRN